MNDLIVDQLDDTDIIINFCTEVGIKRIKSYIKNKDTNEIRFYSQDSSKYRTPKGWKNVERVSLDAYIYPDLTKPENFIKLLKCHWELFNKFGLYQSLGNNESFEINYILTRLKAIRTCRAMGGGEMLDYYLQELRKIDFDYGVLK